MRTYYTYEPATKRLIAVPKCVTIDGAIVINPSAAQSASIGAYPARTTTPPAPPEGKIAVPDGYELVDGAWQRAWKYEDAPPPPPRTFSKLKIVVALTSAGVWAQVKAYIEQAGLYDLYLAAQDFAEDNEYFTQGRQQLQAALGWTDEQVEAILVQAVI